MDILLSGLRAAGEPTRLRLLAICAHGELSVTELTQVLGQSQPRVSRHLKLLVEAGLLERSREGSLVFYRIAEVGESAILARTLVDLMPADDPDMARDLERLEHIRERRAQLADAYFASNAANWDSIRQLHVPEAEVEACLMQLVGNQSIDDYLDIGTGTGRILALLAGRVGRGIGIDKSPEMLALARSQLERASARNVHVRKGDMYAMPVENASMDLATLHLVLHYSVHPELVIAEATRTLRPGGRLLVVDFAPHHEEQLRIEHSHARLGFSDLQMREDFLAAGLEPGAPMALQGDPLTVKLWHGTRAAAH